MAKIVLKDILLKKNITYRQAEIMTGVSKSALQAIANDKRDPRLSTMEQIAAGLNVKISELFESDYK